MNTSTEAYDASAHRERRDDLRGTFNIKMPVIVVAIIAGAVLWAMAGSAAVNALYGAETRPIGCKDYRGGEVAACINEARQ